ncbi:MAG TPA: hypothetical protein VFJ92_11085 [Gemmatimonadales bacterium]|jgi:hypothetical protein|nr:hypothetical protein [Gemmatimonadales bacterium]
MSGCTRLSDRMPEVVHGRSRWTADEAAHLAACAECRRELALLQATVTLGRRTPRLGDAERMAATIERRLTGIRTRRIGVQRVAGLAAAATLLLAVWTKWPERPVASPAGPSRPAAPALVPLPELELLDPAELDSLLQRMEQPSVGGSTLDAPGLGDLEDTELEQVLATWEG